MSAIKIDPIIIIKKNGKFKFVRIKWATAPKAAAMRIAIKPLKYLKLYG